MEAAEFSQSSATTQDNACPLETLDALTTFAPLEPGGLLM